MGILIIFYLLVSGAAGALIGLLIGLMLITAHILVPAALGWVVLVGAGMGFLGILAAMIGAAE